MFNVAAKTEKRDQREMDLEYIFLKKIRNNKFVENWLTLSQTLAIELLLYLIEMNFHYLIAFIHFYRFNQAMLYRSESINS